MKPTPERLSPGCGQFELTLALTAATLIIGGLALTAWAVFS